MTENKTSNDVLENYQTVLGKEFGSIFYHAHDEWCDLWITWKQFENLFGHGPERVELLNKAGGLFFFNVSRYFFRSVLLAICRLSDPIKTSGKENLTVHLFEQYMKTLDQTKRIKTLLDDVKTNTEFARDWRNRRISHNDLGLTNKSAKPLKPATRKQVSNAISLLHNVFTYVTREFMNTHLGDDVIDPLNNEMVMLNRLYLGVEAFDRDLEELKKGNKRPDGMPKWLSNAK